MIAIALGLGACGDDTATTTSQTATTVSTETSTDDGGIDARKVARAGATFLFVRNRLNKRNEKVAQLEADTEKANAEAKKASDEAAAATAEAQDAQKQADAAQQAADTASSTAAADAKVQAAEADAKAAEAKAKEADAKAREAAAEADAASSCAKAIVEIVAEIPKAPSLDEGVAPDNFLDPRRLSRGDGLLLKDALRTVAWVQRFVEDRFQTDTLA